MNLWENVPADKVHVQLICTIYNRIIKVCMIYFCKSCMCLLDSHDTTYIYIYVHTCNLFPIYNAGYVYMHVQFSYIVIGHGWVMMVVHKNFAEAQRIRFGPSIKITPS